LIDEGVSSGRILFHRGDDISDESLSQEALLQIHGHATRVIFLRNLPRLGNDACHYAVNLVIVDIPEGIVSIGHCAFMSCLNLTTIYFPKTLTSIGQMTFSGCSSLEIVDLLHTNLQIQELGFMAFAGCSELKKMMIPDSLQEFDPNANLYDDFFRGCSRLVPSIIDDRNGSSRLAWRAAR